MTAKLAVMIYEDFLKQQIRERDECVRKNDFNNT